MRTCKCVIAKALWAGSAVLLAPLVFESTGAAQLSRPTLTTLWNFSNGFNPRGVTFASGLLYGTVQGGTSGNGAVFQLTPPATSGGSWTEAILYSFTGENGDGASPQGSPVVGINGALYGTTYYGG